MALTLEDLMALQNRERDPIVVGQIPFAVANKLGLRNHNIYLSGASLEHILHAHSDISMIDLLHLPFAVTRGLLVREKAKQNVIVASYLDQETGRRFFSAMKIAQAGTEIWISSFYRSKARQTKRLLSRGEVLKTHV
jgi:hypothetical protein